MYNIFTNRTHDGNANISQMTVITIIYTRVKHVLRYNKTLKCNDARL